MSVGLTGFLRLPKGTLISCSNPFCDETIGRLSKDFTIGDSRLEMDDGTGQGARLDHLPRCKACNHLYVVSESDLMRVHTARGWFPEAGVYEQTMQELAYA